MPTPTVTPEQRARGLARANEQRAANRARYAGTLRRDFLDEPHWLSLARAAGVTLPRWDSPPARARITRFLTKLGRSWTWYHQWHGRGRSFETLNPD